MHINTLQLQLHFFLIGCAHFILRFICNGIVIFLFDTGIVDVSVFCKRAIKFSSTNSTFTCLKLPSVKNGRIFQNPLIFAALSGCGEIGRRTRLRI